MSADYQLNLQETLLNEHQPLVIKNFSSEINKWNDDYLENNLGSTKYNVRCYDLPLHPITDEDETKSFYPSMRVSTMKSMTYKEYPLKIPSSLIQAFLICINIQLT